MRSDCDGRATANRLLHGSFHPTLAILVRSLEVVSAPLLDFTLQFCLFILAFGFISYLLFSWSLESFGSVSEAFYSVSFPAWPSREACSRCSRKFR